jgi:hypothetical protein
LIPARYFGLLNENSTCDVLQWAHPLSALIERWNFPAYFAAVEDRLSDPTTG